MEDLTYVLIEGKVWVWLWNIPLEFPAFTLYYYTDMPSYTLTLHTCNYINKSIKKIYKVGQAFSIKYINVCCAWRIFLKLQV